MVELLRIYQLPYGRLWQHFIKSHDLDGGEHLSPRTSFTKRVICCLGRGGVVQSVLVVGKARGRWGEPALTKRGFDEIADAISLLLIACCTLDSGSFLSGFSGRTGCAFVTAVTDWTHEPSLASCSSFLKFLGDLWQCGFYV